MNNIQILKWIAIIAMIIDHGIKIYFQGFVYVPVISEFTRVSFPLFAFILAYNYQFHTKNKISYMKRLFIFALISQPFFILAFHTVYLNIFFTLFIGMLSFYLIHIRKYLWLLLIIPVGLFVDYGLFGVLLVFSSFFLVMHYNSLFNLELFLNTKNSVLEKARFHLFMYFLLIIFSNLISMIIYGNYHFVVLGALLTIFLIVFAPKIEIKRINKYFYYLVYPVHLFIFWYLF